MFMQGTLFLTRRAAMVALPLATVALPVQAQDFRTITEGQDIRPRTRAEFDARHIKQGANPFVGMWITADGNVRYELLPTGRYDSARGTREGAYRGRYVISGNFIDYVDDTGLIADGQFKDGTLYQYGLLLRKSLKPK